MPSSAMLLSVNTLLQVAESLENVVSRCFGPEGGQVLFFKATGEMLITRDGKTILESLLLDHPIARMIVRCATMHYSLTGDGVKTFVILLCSMLRGLQAIVDKHDHPFCGNIPETTKHRRHSHILKKFSSSLSMFQACVLDPVVIHDLSKHFLSVYFSSTGAMQLCKDAMQSTLEIYFCGRIGNINHKFIAELALDFFYQCLACENSESEMVSVIDELFFTLHTEVPGLPVGNSRILTGVVLHRDFAAYCPAEGERKVLLVTESMHPVLSISSSEFVVKSEVQLQVSQVWMTKQTETIMKHLQDNQVKVLLSSVKQPDIVLFCAKQVGISVIDCISSEEISLLCRITGLSPDYVSVSEMLCSQQLTGTAVATFCRPVLLGSRRFVHLGFKKSSVFDPHCVVLCGPVKGLTQQYVSAFHGAFKMLRQLLKPADISCKHEQAPVAQSSSCNGNKLKKGCSNTRSLKTCADFPVHRGVKPATAPNILQNNGNIGCVTDRLEEVPISCMNKSENDQGKRNESVQENCTVFKQLSREQVKQDKTGAGAVQKPSLSSVERGAVLPVGGTFEILLHYYLRRCSQQCHQSEMSTVSTLVADALLEIPKNIYRSKKGNCSFPQVYTCVVNDLRTKESKHWELKGLEAVSCKHQLLASVLQCVTRLVTIDMLLGVSRGPSRNRDEDSENEL
ncbi:BBSome complex assembly protein BBS10 [Microcaecilia unicolor]|uniref:Bardet-Biedl syndrome 10 protein n=1 Tax=Microcaecilia unicolor TaxID=1415580 RepID=A0A6P7Z3N4_9AMPH|nr:Bardet-Biedl syndrome 10 protein [Microcaecilia unicolor]XP_030070091.1 Bardet-Biedl syndrome 10 protein [Microcaecilia unicolor]